MNSQRSYALLIGAVGVERLAELVVSRRNLALARRQGGMEVGAGHYPVMVALHTGLLAGCLAESHLLRRRFRQEVGIPALAVAIGCQGLRWWCITTLGSQWNTRVVVIPGAERVRRGPYRWLAHPNYVAVALEGAALPLIHDARITATMFSLANAVLLRHRIRTEDEALRLLDHDD